MNKTYDQWLQDKAIVFKSTGLSVERDQINPNCFDFQRDITKWALNRGRAAIFADTGMGKTFMLFAFAEQIVKQLGKRVLILAPLAVARQLEDLGNNKVNVECKYLRADDLETKIVISNYEMLHKFDPNNFEGLILDEASIIKNHMGELRNALMDWSRNTRFKLACTATPSPNDYVELGNMAEFLGIMRYSEMLAMFFINDAAETATWRMKQHAKEHFWRWVASWGVFLNNPRDLGYPGEDYDLPPLNYHIHKVENPKDMAFQMGKLFVFDLHGLDERREARRNTLEARVAKCVEIIGDSTEPWIIWCDLNDESAALKKAIPGAVEVKGSDSLDYKIDNLLAFANGSVKRLVTKVKICGTGMNFQNCKNQLFCGLNDSFEQFYQAIRRSWRYGQTDEVNIHVVISEAETTILDNVVRKESNLKVMRDAVVGHTKNFVIENIQEGATRNIMEYQTDVKEGNNWKLYLGDCVEQIKNIPDDSVDYSLFSPPFSDLFVYSNSDRDMGNCLNSEEFSEHFKYLLPELMRVITPGRLVSMHCMLLPTAKYKDGYIGLRDFRGDLIRAMIDTGFIFASEVTIWADPVIAMQRSKALGLLHKQLKKDSNMSRNGLSQYIITFRKPGVNPKPISHTAEEFPVEIWQRYASPVWMDIKPGDTLQYRSAKANDDVKHICPLQLSIIERCLDLWTAPGDMVLDPFNGIGSTGYVSLLKGRQYTGIELKPEYFNAAVNNLSKVQDNAPYALVESYSNALG